MKRFKELDVTAARMLMPYLSRWLNTVTTALPQDAKQLPTEFAAALAAGPGYVFNPGDRFSDLDPTAKIAIEELLRLLDANESLTVRESVAGGVISGTRVEHVGWWSRLEVGVHRAVVKAWEEWLKS